MNILIDDNIKDILPEYRLACMEISGVTITGTPAPLMQDFTALQEEVGKIYKLDILTSVPRIAAVRNMYRKLRFDPGRYRPASEALVRRVLQNKGLYYLNSAVDVNNYCSLKFLLPFGLYDRDQIDGDVAYALSTEGTYQNIAGNEVSTDGKPFLTDRVGVFGNPTSDSRRTAVTLKTRNLLSVIYVDTETEEDELNSILTFVGEMFVRYNGGIVTAKKIIKA
jgi:DNA/RNA-binding domain of Phe-tRNA-synthetase-like protein